MYVHVRNVRMNHQSNAPCQIRHLTSQLLHKLTKEKNSLQLIMIRKNCINALHRAWNRNLSLT